MRTRGFEMQTRWTTITLPGCLFLACSAVMGQINTATILGTVTDGSGATVPAAAIKLLNAATQEAHEASSDTTGSYIFDRLPVGECQGAGIQAVRAQGRARRHTEHGTGRRHRGNASPQSSAERPQFFPVDPA